MNDTKATGRYHNIQAGDFSMINYQLHPESLRTPFPSWLEPLRFTDAGEPFIIVTTVFFSARGRKQLKWLRFIQNNYRTYVRNKRTGQTGVWFFKMYVNTLWYPMIRWTGLPVGLKKMEVEKEKHTLKWRQYWLKDRLQSGIAEIRNTGKRLPVLQGFRDIVEQNRLLISPTVAYFMLHDGSIGSMQIGFDSGDHFLARAEETNLPWFEKNSIVSEKEAPPIHSSIWIPEAELRIGQTFRNSFI